MVSALAGLDPVEESARRLRAYRYMAERTMRALAGWIALTPELAAKLLLGRHVWDIAQHADAFGKRLLELRAPAQASAPATAGAVALMDAVEAPEAPGETVERLVGVYRVIKPHLLATYQWHLDRANPVYEPPTRRILGRCIEDERRHLRAGETVLGHLADTPTLRERAARHESRIADLLAAAGGVTGQGLPPRVPLELTDDPEATAFIALAGRRARWPVPADLGTALDAAGAALAAGDADRLETWLAPSLPLDGALRAEVAGARFGRHRLVAFARVGEQYLVKFRLERPDAAVVVLTRWIRAGGGWRVAALTLAKVESLEPA
ncbi:MAG: hypothetical protein L0027_07360 [Candidatus Rokubacteria bacterium]|nr:hypothetical protein [Candidatus Rokubacteria bacterium]